jgi:hypothetical protein
MTRLLSSKSLPHAVDTEAIRSFSVMAATVIKKKHVIILWIQNLHHINTIFELQDHVVVRPVSLSICSILEFNYKW